jgi:hypothetical protein
MLWGFVPELRVLDMFNTLGHVPKEFGVVDVWFQKPMQDAPVGAVGDVSSGSHVEEMAEAHSSFPRLESKFPCLAVQPEHGPEEGDGTPESVCFEEQSYSQICDGIAKGPVFFANPEYRG